MCKLRNLSAWKEVPILSDFPLRNPSHFWLRRVENWEFSPTPEHIWMGFCFWKCPSIYQKLASLLTLKCHAWAGSSWLAVSATYWLPQNSGKCSEGCFAENTLGKGETEGQEHEKWGCRKKRKNPGGRLVVWEKETSIRQLGWGGEEQGRSTSGSPSFRRFCFKSVLWTGFPIFCCFSLLAL